MDKQFFTSREAAQLTGCSLRQLQYWREKEVVVPTITGTGTGRSVYYSYSELVELKLMEYWLAIGFSFDSARILLDKLRFYKDEFDYLNPETTERVMFYWSHDREHLLLNPFERDRAIECLDQGLAVIPLWFDQIHHQLRLKLKSSTS